MEARFLMISRVLYATIKSWILDIILHTTPDIRTYGLSSSACSSAAVGTSNFLRPLANQSTIAMTRNPIRIGGA
jgi:hypothetical protein